MKYLMLIAMVFSFSVNAADRTRTYSRCSTKPITIQTACDLKVYAASQVGTAAYGFFQGYVVAAFRQPVDATSGCYYSGTDQQAVQAAISYLTTVSSTQCSTISAADALAKAFSKMPVMCN